MWAQQIQKWSLAAACVSAALATSCASSAPDDHHDNPAAPAHLELAAAVPVDSQSAGVRVEVFRCGDTRPVVSGRVGFSAGSLHEFPAFSNTPARFAKDHLFAHSGFSLRHGCYFATAQPLDIHNQPVERCTIARTPDVPLGPKVGRSLLLIARCGDRPSDTPTIGGRLNFAPLLTDLTSRFVPASGGFEVCAQTFDAQGDDVRVTWSARTDSGRAVEPGDVQHSAQSGSRRTTCVHIPVSDEPIDVRAVARDGSNHAARGFVSREVHRLYRYGVAASSRAQKTERLPAASSLGCAESLASAIEGWTYWIRRGDQVLSPTDELSTVRPGDSVQVELDVAEGCDTLEVEFTSLTRGAVVGRDRGTFAPGAHVLWVDVPEPPFTLALALESMGEYHVLDHHRMAQQPVETPSLVGVSP